MDPCDTVSTVCASSEIDALTCGELEEALNRLMDSGKTRIVLDLSATVYISSAGLRVLLATAKRLHGAGRFAIAAANQDVRGILEMTGFTRIIDTYGTAEKAAAALSRPHT
jgi:anti-anti-sigma factor